MTRTGSRAAASYAGVSAATAGNVLTRPSQVARPTRNGDRHRHRHREAVFSPELVVRESSGGP